MQHTKKLYLHRSVQRISDFPLKKKKRELAIHNILDALVPLFPSAPAILVCFSGFDKTRCNFLQNIENRRVTSKTQTAQDETNDECIVV